MNTFSPCQATLLSLVFFVVFGCKPEEKAHANPELAKIDSLESEMRSQTEKNPAEPNLELAMHLAKAYQNYQAGHPDDSLSPRFLFKAGQVIENVFDDKGRAAELYFKVYKTYPGSKSAPFALFMTGNLYHTVNDTVRAIEMLQFFIAKYPDHELKKDAAAMILNLGGDPDTNSRPVKEMPLTPKS